MEQAEIIVKLRSFNGDLIDHGEHVLDALDSLDLVELAEFIRRDFGISVSLEDITPANFGTLSAIVDMISARYQGRE